jgi:hypothetical protein
LRWSGNELDEAAYPGCTIIVKRKTSGFVDPLIWKARFVERLGLKFQDSSGEITNLPI